MLLQIDSSRSHVLRGNAFLDALRPLEGVKPTFQWAFSLFTCVYS